MARRATVERRDYREGSLGVTIGAHAFAGCFTLGALVPIRLLQANVSGWNELVVHINRSVYHRRPPLSVLSDVTEGPQT